MKFDIPALAAALRTETPAETAISILAEAMALRAGRLGGPLREAAGRIHVER